MRDPRRTLAKHKRRRRAILAIFIMASSPLMADDPQENVFGVLPPLPLTSITDINPVHDNPFCESTCNFGFSPIQLTSGNKNSSIRLKPIGAAIGLHSIESDEPVKPERPAMTIEAISPAAVRNNPLVKSTHRENPELVDTEIIDKAANPSVEVETEPAPEPRASSIILVPPAPARPLRVCNDSQSKPSAVLQAPASVVSVEPNEAKTPASKSALSLKSAIIPVPAVSIEPVAPACEAVTIDPAVSAEPVVSANPKAITESVASIQPAVIQPAVIQPAVIQPVGEPVDETPEAIAQVAPEPVLFSLSDDRKSSSDLGAAAAAAMEPSAQAESDNATAPGEVARVDKPAQEKSPVALDPPVRVAADNPVELNVVEPLVLDESGTDALEPFDEVIDPDGQAPIAIYRSEPIVAAPVELPEPTLHTRRYRPPVAVKSVPLTYKIAAEEPEGGVVSTVQRVLEIDLGGRGQIAASKVKLTPLYMNLAQVRSLTIGGEVRGVKVWDKSVCQAVAAGPNQLKLIGTGNGVTRLVVWAGSDDSDSSTQMRAFEIHVKDAVGATGDQVGNKADFLNQSIRRAFPHCSVMVRQHLDQLVVTGRCDSDESAKKIIRMVRKTCLVPVQDNLLVR